MKVYIVLEYLEDHCHIHNVYATKDAAIQAVKRANIEIRVGGFYPSLHIITKSVKGLAGIKFKIDGKKRYLEAPINKIKRGK